MLNTRYGVFYFGKLVRSFDTHRQATEWQARAPWQYWCDGLKIRAIEVES